MRITQPLKPIKELCLEGKLTNLKQYIHQALLLLEDNTLKIIR